MSRRTLEAFALIVALLFCLTILAPLAHCQSCVTNSQVTLTGSLRAANGLPSSNSIISLAPSQVGFIAGCGINLPTQTTCATSTDGSVVQTPNPLTPSINTASGAGSLLAGVYYTVYEFYDALGNATLPSPETVTTLSISEALVVNPPVSGVPATAAGMKVFIGTTSGGETLQGSTVGSASFVQSTALASGASPGSSNTTVCVVTANDSVWPTGTGYIVNMTDSVGNGIPGFPMQWQLNGAGSTINLANGLPYYHGVVTYPAQILASPQNHGAQSISGPLNFGGYNVLNVGKLGVGTSTPGFSIDVTNGLINSNAGYLINGSAGTSGQAPCSDGTAIDSFCTFVTSLPAIYYQTVINGSHATDAVAQRGYLSVGNETGSPTGLVAADAIGVGSQVSRTALSVNAIGGTSSLSTDPHVVITSGGGVSGHCAQFDSTVGGISDSGAACQIGARTCNANGCYETSGNGTIHMWGTTATFGGSESGAFTLTFPTAVTDSSSVVMTFSPVGCDGGTGLGGNCSGGGSNASTYACTYYSTSTTATTIFWFSPNTVQPSTGACTWHAYAN